MASLGVSWTEAGPVVVSAVGVYLAFLVLLRIVGQRAVASMSRFDVAAAVAVGAARCSVARPGCSSASNSGEIGSPTRSTLIAPVRSRTAQATSS